MANLKPTYYYPLKPNPSGVAKPSRPRMSRSRMSKVDKQWLRLANERPEHWSPDTTDPEKIARMKRLAIQASQAPPIRRKPESKIKPKPGIGAGGTRRTRRKGVKVYARKRRGSAYSLKSAFNF